MQKRISIIFWEGYLEVSPTLISLIQYFSEKKQFVDVYIRDDNEFELAIIDILKNEFVTFFRITSQRTSKRFHRITRFHDYFYLYLNKFSEKLATDEKILFYQLRDSYYVKNFIEEVKKISSNKRYDVVFCVDNRGLYIHHKSGQIAKKVINLSLEIEYLKPEKKYWFSKKIKRHEIKYVKTNVAYTIIQDIYRWDIYKRVNKINTDNYKLLPNTIRKVEFANSTVKTFFFNDKFNFPKDTIVVLAAGLISEFVCSSKIAKAVGQYAFKENVKVVFHNRMAEENEAYYQNLRDTGKDNLVLSLEPVPFAEIHKLFTSSHIGLVMYDTANADENYSVIGAASGKLYQYMQYGLPVIATNNKGLSDIVIENEIGLVINDITELPSAIEKIIANYNFYSENSKRTFIDKYDLDIYLDKIYADL